MNNETSAVQSPATSKLALIVDDDAFSEAFISEMLTELGVTEISSASSGRIALQILSSLPRLPDILICDVFMPDMDGIEFLNELAQKGYQGGIILVSGLDTTIMSLAKDMALANGLNLLGAFTKPVSMKVLADALNL